MKKKSFSYRVLKSLGINLSEQEYGGISIFGAVKKGFKCLVNSILLKYCMYSSFLAPFNYRFIRPRIWRLMGCSVGKNVFIGLDVWIDITNSHLIHVHDGAHITTRCLLLCHQRDLKSYYVGADSSKLPYKKGTIVIGRGAMLGMGTIVLPGVTIGEGSIVAAGSIVTKDIEPWSIASGAPAKIVRRIPCRES